jgi:D-3-phosphoglycerate dehydrogenase
VKVIVRYGIGFDNIDLEAATDNDVVVCNITDYCIDEVATHAMALLLALNRKLPAHDRAARKGERVPLGLSGPLRGETLGLVAFGNIARAVAERAKPFGLNVIAHDPYIEGAVAAERGVRLAPLDEVMSQSDYVSVHTPLNAETRGLVGAPEIAKMKPSAYLITTCRGGVVSEKALYDALKDGRIAGAGIDVWDPEPVQAANPLLEFENVIATPHSAFYSDASLPLLQQRVGETVADVLRGEMPNSVVNPAVLERVTLRPRGS